MFYIIIFCFFSNLCFYIAIIIFCMNFAFTYIFIRIIFTIFRSSPIFLWTFLLINIFSFLTIIGLTEACSAVVLFMILLFWIISYSWFSFITIFEKLTGKTLLFNILLLSNVLLLFNIFSLIWNFVFTR